MGVSMALGRIKALDGLRGTAALIVVCSHFYGLFGVTNGNLGVDVFFVLSGFLITSLLLEEMKRTGTIGFRNFYIRRFLRLAPALIACVLFFGAVDLIFGVFPRDIILKSMATSLLYVSNWIRASDAWNLYEFGHTWSLSIEEQFYLIWPVALLFFVSKVRTPAQILLSVLLIVAALEGYRQFLIATEAPKMWISASFHTRAGAIFMGAIPAIIMHYWTITQKQKKALTVAAYAGVGMIVCAILMANDYMTWKQPLVILSTAAIVAHLAVNAGTVIHRFLSVDWLVYTGKLSYGLYLYHYPLWYLTIHKFWSKALDTGEKQAICLFMLMPVSYLMAWASFKYIETPALAFKERFRSSGSHIEEAIRV